jgi:hypothetical protein
LGVVDVSSQGVVFKQARVFRCVRQKMVFPYDRRLDITKGSRMIAIDAPQKSKIR